MSVNLEALKQQMIMLKQIVMLMQPEERKIFATFCMVLFKEVFDQK